MAIGKPRFVNITGVRGDKPRLNVEETKILLVPLHVMKVVYVVPVIMSFLLHIAVHHNVLSTSQTRIISLFLSILFPTFLMLVCAHKQLHFWPVGPERESANATIEHCKHTVFALLLVCVQDHPILDEIKSFSGLPEPFPDALLIGALFAVYFAAILHKYRSFKSKAKDDDDEMFDMASLSGKKINWTKILIDLMTALSVSYASASISTLVGIPFSVIPVSIMGAVCITEYYFNQSWQSSSSKLFLVVFSILSIAIVAISFTHSTVFFLNFTFEWHNYTLSMKQFCKVFALLLAIATGFPALISRSKQIQSSDLPSVIQLSKTQTRTLESAVFEFFFPLFTLFLSGVELMIREQDWNKLHLSVEIVYPTYYLVGSMILICISSYSLYSSNAIGYIFE
jgi:hypothetical protein